MKQSFLPLLVLLLNILSRDGADVLANDVEIEKDTISIEEHHEKMSMVLTTLHGITNKLAALEAKIEMLEDDAKLHRETVDNDNENDSAVVINHSVRHRSTLRSARGDSFHRLLKSKKSKSSSSSSSKEEETCPLVEEDCDTVGKIALCLENPAKNNTDCVELQKAVAAFALSGPSAGGIASGGPVPIPAQCKPSLTNVGISGQPAPFGIELNGVDGTTCGGNGAFSFEVNPTAADQLVTSTDSYAYFTLPSTYYKGKSIEIPVVRWSQCNCACLCEHDQFCVMAKEKAPVVDFKAGNVNVECFLYYVSQTPLTAERLLDEQCDNGTTNGRDAAAMAKVTAECPKKFGTFTYFFPDCTAQSQISCGSFYTSS